MAAPFLLEVEVRISEGLAGTRCHGGPPVWAPRHQLWWGDAPSVMAPMLQRLWPMSLLVPSSPGQFCRSLASAAGERGLACSAGCWESWRVIDRPTIQWYSVVRTHIFLGLFGFRGSGMKLSYLRHHGTCLMVHGEVRGGEWHASRDSND
jgi:hypothetical protein